jgi:hypothetical protein
MGEYLFGKDVRWMLTEFRGSYKQNEQPGSNRSDRYEIDDSKATMFEKLTYVKQYFWQTCVPSTSQIPILTTEWMWTT